MLFDFIGFKAQMILTMLVNFCFEVKIKVKVYPGLQRYSQHRQVFLYAQIRLTFFLLYPSIIAKWQKKKKKIATKNAL